MENPGLEFEKPIQELRAKLDTLLAQQQPGNEAAIRELKAELDAVTREVYEHLTPWQIVKVARHPDRPQTADYLSLVFDEFVELHGDRHFGDDAALVSGFAKLDNFKVMLVGHQKGRTTKERTACSFGCAHPEGYRKALMKMKLAAKYAVPVITLIDTPGAYPGIGAEERGQAQAIAENMFEMSRLGTPIICVVIGEGGSGGALGIGVGDRVAMLEHAYYSVISPEGCAGILWKSHKFAEQAAEALRFTSRDLKGFDVVDDIIDEPLGGAHRDHHQMAARLRMYLLRTLRELSGTDPQVLLDARYNRFRKLGVFLEGGDDGSDGHDSGSDCGGGDSADSAYAADSRHVDSHAPNMDASHRGDDGDSYAGDSTRLDSQQVHTRAVRANRPKYPGVESKPS